MWSRMTRHRFTRANDLDEQLFARTLETSVMPTGDRRCELPARWRHCRTRFSSARRGSAARSDPVDADRADAGRAGAGRRPCSADRLRSIPRRSRHQASSTLTVGCLPRRTASSKARQSAGRAVPPQATSAESLPRVTLWRPTRYARICPSRHRDHGVELAAIGTSALIATTTVVGQPARVVAEFSLAPVRSRTPSGTSSPRRQSIRTDARDAIEIDAGGGVASPASRELAGGVPEYRAGSRRLECHSPVSLAALPAGMLDRRGRDAHRLARLGAWPV